MLRATKQFVDQARIAAMWREALAQGVALRSLGDLLETRGLENARRFIRAQTVSAGELLWQGQAGYCVAMESGSRAIGSNVKTLKLQLGGTGEFQGQMTLPVAAMLATDDIAHTLGDQHLATLKVLISQISSNVVTGS